MQVGQQFHWASLSHSLPEHVLVKSGRRFEFQNHWQRPRVDGCVLSFLDDHNTLHILQTCFFHRLILAAHLVFAIEFQQVVLPLAIVDPTTGPLM